MSKRFFRNSPLLAAALCLIAAAPGPGVREKADREPIVVTSDRMEADELGNIHRRRYPEEGDHDLDRRPSGGLLRCR
jgi:hypothetical protein